MITASPWKIHTSSVTEWLKELLKQNRIDKNDTVWSGPDGGYAVGQPSVDDMDDDYLMSMTDAGQVKEWLDQ